MSHENTLAAAGFWSLLFAQYSIDLHGGSLSSWDDEGFGCDGSDQIVAHATKLLTDAIEGSLDGHAVVSVRDEAGLLVATVTMSQTKGLRVSWAVRPEAL